MKDNQRKLLFILNILSSICLVIILECEYLYFILNYSYELVSFDHVMLIMIFIVLIGITRVLIAIITIIMLLIFVGIIIMIIFTQMFLLSFMFLLYIISACFSVICIINLRKSLYMTEKSSLTLKKIILDLGTKYTRLNILDIAEKCKSSRKSIKILISDMIANKEIFAKYYEDTKLVEFDQDINIEELDNLMNIYEKWEKERLEKK